MIAIAFAALLLAQDPPPPTVAEAQVAFDILNACKPAQMADCKLPIRAYRTHGLKCIPAAPVEGLPSVACRVDMTITDINEDRKTEVRRVRDECMPFVRRDAGWRVDTESRRPCGIPSMLRSDPAAIPNRAELERALVGAFQCYDGEDSHCARYAEDTRVSDARCTPIKPDKEGLRRIACRVTGTVGYMNRSDRHEFNNLCVRLRRYTDPGESPALWGWSWEAAEAEKPCEARTRGVEIRD